jgi:hypothetical protein
MADRYRHKVRGTTYRVLYEAAKASSIIAALDEMTMVVYQGEEDGLVWVRPTSEFFDGRFELVGHAQRAPSTPDILGVLKSVHSALDDALGDTDISHIESDDELRDVAPVQWAAQWLAHAIELLEGGSAVTSTPNEPAQRAPDVVPAILIKAVIGNIREHERFEAISAPVANEICRFLERAIEHGAALTSTPGKPAQQTRNEIIEECARACEGRIKGTDGLPGGDDYGHYAPYNCEDLACAKAVRALSAVTSTDGCSMTPVDAWALRLATLEGAIHDSIESLERNSTSAPVVECLKAALSSTDDCHK